MDADAQDALRKALHAKVQSSFLFSFLTYVDTYQESMESNWSIRKISIQRFEFYEY